jgi:DNA-binding NtrC family response regulator
MQAKLLRVLQEREVTRVGTGKSIPVDVRIIAATHQDLEAMIDEGRFRPDLYFRLKVFQIRIPELRLRPDDIPALASAAVARWNEKNREPSRRIAGLSEETLEILGTYEWPGNVRELMAAIEHACIVCDGNRLLACHLPSEVRDHEPEPVVVETGGRVDGAKRYHAPDPEEEKIAIRQALNEAGGNRTRAAALLGMGRTTLWQKIKALGLE